MSYDTDFLYPDGDALPLTKRARRKRRLDALRSKESEEGIAYLDAYALRVAEAVREACDHAARDHRRYRPFDTDMSARGARVSVADQIRALDLHAILKGVER